MSNQEALEILIHYNKWRRDSHFHLPDKNEMPDPANVGKAIDLAITALSEICDKELSTESYANYLLQLNLP